MAKPTENPGTQGAREVWVSGGITLATADGDAQVAISKVADGVYRLQVEGLSADVELLKALLQEMRLTNHHLAILSNDGSITASDMEA